jgi:DNA-directed RNA polymerase specialized sigma24 family protein
MMAMMIEIDFAYWKLPKDDKKLLFLRHAEAMDFPDIAKEMELGSEDAARMRHKRAIRKLINKIGGFKPYSDNDFEQSQQVQQESS